MKNYLLLFIGILVGLVLTTSTSAQTVIPNADFENWISHGSYEDPQSWDTPNEEAMSIPFFGVTVVSKNASHESGAYSAKLETKHMLLPPMDIPGFMTLGKLHVNIDSGTYTITGGAPVIDMPTHLKGYYKYSPQGGDSCLIGIGLFKTTAGVKDSVGFGYFSTKVPATDWTPFSAWIDYDTIIQPDTMNIIALSTAQEVMTPGTVLYVDDLWLDYTVGMENSDSRENVQFYQDKETERVLVFLDFPSPRITAAALFDMTGRKVLDVPARMIRKDRIVFSYSEFNGGVYILVISHGNKRVTKKFIFTY
jgi:hypothetical protein